MCSEIIALKPDVVITEKGVSDLASHYFQKAGVTAIRRVKKTDNNRIGKVCGATIVARPEELQESDVGTGCGLFEVRKYGDEYFMFLDNCKGACRGVEGEVVGGGGVGAGAGFVCRGLVQARC